MSRLRLLVNICPLLNAKQQNLSRNIRCHNEQGIAVIRLLLSLRYPQALRTLDSDSTDNYSKSMLYEIKNQNDIGNLADSYN